MKFPSVLFLLVAAASITAALPNQQPIHAVGEQHHAAPANIRVHIELDGVVQSDFLQTAFSEGSWLSDKDDIGVQCYDAGRKYPFLRSMKVANVRVETSAS